jgi:pimeloyl-ACP methyl ester carboxylesterase
LFFGLRIKNFTLKKFLNEKLFPKVLGAYLSSLAFINPTKSGDKALQIFGTPRKGKIRPKDALFLDGFEKNDLWNKGLKIQTYKKGNGAYKLLLLHGWESNAARWKHLIQYLETRVELTIYAIDGPAHGNSSGLEFNSILYAEFIDIAIKAYQPDAIIGHSIGAGSIAYCLSEMNPHKIDKLVLMGSPNAFTEIVYSYVNIIGLNRAGQKALHNAIIRKYNMQPADYNISKFVSKINCRGLIIHDTDDHISVVENAKCIAENFQGAALYITSGFGHSLQHHDVFRKIADFLSSRL